MVLLTNIGSDVDHIVKLHPEYAEAEAEENIDINKLSIILRQSVNQHGMFDVLKIKIQWANYKKSTFYDKEMSYQLYPWPNISFDFKTRSTIFADFLSSRPISNASLTLTRKSSRRY